MPRRRRRVGRVPGRERRPLGRRQQDNTWVNCLTIAELKRSGSPARRSKSWKDVRAGFPDVKIKLFGAGTDSGTFDFFTEEINGKAKASRSDYLGDRGRQRDRPGRRGRARRSATSASLLRGEHGQAEAAQVDSGSGGCVAPSIKTVQAGTYRPLSRPLFIYAKQVLQAPRGRRVDRLHLQQREGDREEVRFISLTDSS